MPVFNGTPFLRESIGSVLSQRFRDFELVAVDDGSSDDSWAVLQALAHDRRVKLIRCEQNRGAASARNEGIAKSDSEFIAFLDADDVAQPRRLAMQVQVLEKYRRFDVVFGKAAVIENSGLKLARSLRMSWPEVGPTLLFWNCIVQSSVMARRQRLQPYDAEFEPAEDYELWTRLAPVRTFFPLDAVLVAYREHAKGVSKRLPERMKKSVARIYSHQLKRLGVPDRVELHSRLIAWPWDADFQHLEEAEAWLMDLLSANRIYQYASFRRVVEKIWFEVCIGSWGLGPVAFTIYRRSKLARLSPSRLWEFARRYGRKALMGSKGF